MKRLQAYYAKAERFELPLLLALSLPVLFRPSLGEILLLAAPCMWALRWGLRGYPARRTLLDWPIGLLFVMLLVSLLVTPVMDLTWPKVLAAVLGIFLYYAAVMRGERELPEVVAWYLLAGVAVTGLGLLGTNWLAKFPAFGALTSRMPFVASALPGEEQGFHPNVIAGSLLWIIPVQLALFIFWLSARPRDRLRRVAGLGLAFSLALTLVTLLATQSRGAWSGFVAAVLVMCLLAGGRGVLVAGGAAASSALAIAYVGPARLMAVFFPALQGGPGYGNLNLAFRVELWRTAMRGIADFPFTGMGLGAFQKVASLLYPIYVDPSYNFGHAHNQLLHVGVELGIPGLIAYLGLWVLAAWMVLDAWRHSMGWLRALAIGTAGALVGYFVFGLTDVVALAAKPGLLFWYLLGLIVAVWLNTRTAPVNQVSS